MEHQQAIVEWIVKMRFDTVTAAINAQMWIVLPGSERLNITSVYDPDGRRRDIEIRARQVA
jgi:head-tail adaptor